MPDPNNPARVTGEELPLVRTQIFEIPVRKVVDPRCATTGDPALFFSGRQADIAAAIMICRGCPARAACLQGAVERGESYGVWAGFDFDLSRQGVRRA